MGDTTTRLRAVRPRIVIWENSNEVCFSVSGT